MAARSPYATALYLGRAVPTHVPASALEDVDRVRAYETYEDIYHNHPEVFSAVFSNAAEDVVFRRLIPSGRSIVEATNRYLARGLAWAARPPTATSSVDPLASESATGAGDEAVSASMAALEALFAREEFGAKFLSLKRWMLIRGDAMLHLTGDLLKAEGRRLSIHELNPGTYFPIRDPADAERVIGCYIVNVVMNDDDEEIVARLEYQRVLDDELSARYNGAPVGSVFVRLSFWELDGWDDRASEEDLASVPAPARFGADRFATLLEGTTLPAPISTLPVYHIRNSRRGGELFGVSEMQGIETLIAGINQTATDEEVAIAMQGLGVYWTDSGRPLKADGTSGDWVISPAAMLELEDGKRIGRIEGVGSVQPSLDHINLLKTEAREASGTPDVAVGSVEVSVATSGVALAIQMTPMTAKNEEKEEEIIAKLSQMVFDLLTAWLPAYEGWSDLGVTVLPVFDDPLPKNSKEVVDELSALVAAKIVSASWARGELTRRLGYTFSATEADDIAAEAAVTLDLEGARMDAAVAADPGMEVGVGSG